MPELFTVDQIEQMTNDINHRIATLAAPDSRFRSRAAVRQADVALLRKNLEKAAGEHADSFLARGRLRGRICAKKAGCFSPNGSTPKTLQKRTSSINSGRFWSLWDFREHCCNPLSWLPQYTYFTWVPGPSAPEINRWFLNFDWFSGTPMTLPSVRGPAASIRRASTGLRIARWSGYPCRT